MRIQVNIPEDVVSHLDEIAKKIGLSRSSLCALYISDGLRLDKQIYNLKEKKEEP